VCQGEATESCESSFVHDTWLSRNHGVLEQHLESVDLRLGSFLGFLNTLLEKVRDRTKNRPGRSLYWSLETVKLAVQTNNHNKEKGNPSGGVGSQKSVAENFDGPRQKRCKVFENLQVVDLGLGHTDRRLVVLDRNHAGDCQNL